MTNSLQAAFAYGASVTPTEAVDFPAYKLWRKARRYAYSDYGREQLSAVFHQFDADHYAAWPFGIMRLTVDHNANWTEQPLTSSSGDLFVLVAWPCPADRDEKMSRLYQFPQPGTAVFGWSIRTGKVVQLTYHMSAGVDPHVSRDEPSNVWAVAGDWGAALYRRRFSHARKVSGMARHACATLPLDGCSPGLWLSLDGLTLDTYYEQVKPVGPLRFHLPQIQQQFTARLYGEIAEGVELRAEQPARPLAEIRRKPQPQPRRQNYHETARAAA